MYSHTLKVTCATCSDALIDSMPKTIVTDHVYSFGSRTVDALIDMKNRGGLITPSSPILTILSRVESIIRRIGADTILKQRSPPG